MIVKYGEGRTEYGPGVSIELTGGEVATAIDAWLDAYPVSAQGKEMKVTMTYRDESEALRARVVDLEARLATKKSVDGRWEVTLSTTDAGRIQFVAACAELDLRVQFDISAAEAIQHALSILKLYGQLHPAIATEMDSRVASFRKHVIETIS